MSKSVMLSIAPKWCELIASGQKTVEVRKTKPKLDTPFKVYIYCTQGEALAYPNLNNPKFHFMRTNNGTSFGRKMTVSERNESDYTFANGKVIGEFVCDSVADYEAELWDDKTFERIQEFCEPYDFSEYGEYEYKTIATNEEDDWKENMLCKTSCLTIEELRKYLGSGITVFHGWHISGLVIYDKPKELGEFFYACKKSKGTDCSVCIDNRENICKSLERPPQSWCYVEKL